MGMHTDELYFKPRLQVINTEQIQQIHMATLEVLERTGIKLTHPKARMLLADAGARVDKDRVRIPSWMVEDAIQKAPKRIVLGKRTGERTVTLERDKSYFGPSLDCIDYMDPATHNRTRFESRHVEVTAALCDALPGFDWCMTIGMADDVPADIADRIVARSTLQFCEKPLVFCCKDTNSVNDIYEMALLLCGGKENFEKTPTIVHYSEPISPLVYYDPAVDKILFCAQKGIPLINFPAPQACGSSPATFAGTIVQGSAESLSGLVMHQLANPGAPFIYGAFTTIMDMRTSIFSYGANELSLMTGALAQMAQHYQLPFFGTAGATDAKFCDAQAGAEAAFQCLSAAAIGSGLIHDCSSWMDHGNLVSPEFMVLVNDIVTSVKHYMEGIPVTRETMALDIIDKVGPGGHYLQEKHTMDHFRKIKYSELFERQVHDNWKSQGAMTLEQRLQKLTLEKMNHRPKVLPEKIIKELDRMQTAWK
ncbi:MAG: trimethylamine methyltransferase family protein [Proteobacteria bacterium]|nr:trimethylamine methyltransferase family protein [Pseudomonadota bacterium]MBU1583663.1 trimethylamine methyltransferase family protein [Pseudomonadota bacterium]MBU2454388.1 trimethylamine methyltransferase family protein [Pseudomonadota bacterium]MBU2628065.1 trimethylamine methyltransferase family protein [Pseudomonadota bacterium]